MPEQSKKRDQLHLINLIAKRLDNTPNFAIFLGAGASISSGVRSTNSMINEWHAQLYNQSKTKTKIEDWLLNQDWYQDEEEYSLLFEMVYDQPSQRRIYLEGCIADGKPSWGYIYLANLIANNYFNVCFTPNFDDLLNEACCFYADIRPIVCAHDSAVAQIRVTPKRPKIIKLHGDFLYDDIKNTLNETYSLERNMREKFLQFAREYGLVVIGYGGNDKSIMDILDMMLREKGFFPNGIYWCLRKGSKISKKLQRLLRNENVYWVEIEGFDEFMAELHEKIRLTLPDAVRDPYKATTKKLNNFIEPRKVIKHPIIQKAMKDLTLVVENFEKIISGKGTEEETQRLVPHKFLADKAYASGKYEDALIYLDKAKIENPNNIDLDKTLVSVYIAMEDFDKAILTTDEMIKKYPTNSLGYLLKGIVIGTFLKKPKNARFFLNKALKLAGDDKEKICDVLCSRSNNYLLLERWNKALIDAQRALMINSWQPALIFNKTLALQKLGRDEEARIIVENMLPKLDWDYDFALAYARLGEKKKMLKSLARAVKEYDPLGTDAKYDPDFVEFYDDPEFQKIVNRENNS